MSFCFNFCSDSEKSEKLNAQLSQGFVAGTKQESHSGVCDFISVLCADLSNPSEDISFMNIGDFAVKYALISSLKRKTEDETFSQVDALNTDIIPGKYEGGLKIWECSLDLSLYLAEKDCIKKGDSVLELGCGAGLPGIIAYLKGANVTFQDFNSEVLRFVTIPNTVLNTPEDKRCQIPEVCKYLYGDWECINKKYYSSSAEAKKYDVILTSETIYEKSNQIKLLKLMKSALKAEGIIYVAAKIHYFGVGGGIADFEMLVNEDEMFEISLVKRIAVGVERQILMMKYRGKVKE